MSSCVKAKLELVLEVSLHCRKLEEELSVKTENISETQMRMSMARQWREDENRDIMEDEKRRMWVAAVWLQQIRVGAEVISFCATDLMKRRRVGDCKWPSSGVGGKCGSTGLPASRTSAGPWGDPGTSTCLPARRGMFSPEVRPNREVAYSVCC
jgi:hypothetical protein